MCGLIATGLPIGDSVTAVVDSVPVVKVPFTDDGASVLEECALHLPDQEMKIRLGKVQVGCGDAVMLDIGWDVLVMWVGPTGSWEIILWHTDYPDAESWH